MVGIVGTIALSIAGPGAIAQEQSESPASDPPTRSEQLMNRLQDVPSRYEIGRDFFEDRDENWPTITQTDTSLFAPTLPSLWWSREQLPHRWWNADDGQTVRWQGHRLIRRWTAFYSNFGEASIIDIQLDSFYWDRLDYAQQYGILNQLGTTGMSYGYQVRLYRSTELVGLHTCDFSSVPQLENSPDWEVPIPELTDVQCSVAVGPFVRILQEDLFSPP